MGSSCFSRGNRENLRIIENFIRDNQIDCALSGRGCAGNCMNGPNINIDGIDFERVDSGTLIDLLSSKLLD